MCHILHLGIPTLHSAVLSPASMPFACILPSCRQLSAERWQRLKEIRAWTSATALTALSLATVFLRSFVPFVPCTCQSRNLPSHAYLWSSPNDMKGPASLWPRFPCHVPAEKVVLAREDEEQHQVLMAFTILVAMPAWIPVSCQLHRSSLSS